MTDVNVQFFSDLNGLTIGNNWGDLIRLLDTCLANGKPLPSIILQNVDSDTGDITLEFSANHSCLLLQIVELSGFSPSQVNGKYRIKGIPNTTTLILKAVDKNLVVTAIGTAKLPSLGYDIVFRDEGDVKRVYRAKNPRAEHPYIRVDESITSDTGNYTTTYAKSAMVGLLAHMDHIDDYSNPEVQQLPFDPLDPSKNWNITGTGASVIRGWSKWYWARRTRFITNESSSPTNGNHKFTIVGDPDVFYFLEDVFPSGTLAEIRGCGLYNTPEENSITRPWFLMSLLKTTAANSNSPEYDMPTGSILGNAFTSSKFLITKYVTVQTDYGHTYANPVMINYQSGNINTIPNSSVPATDIVLYSDDGYLRGTLNHIFHAGKKITISNTTPLLDDKDMYVVGNFSPSTGYEYPGALYFYLGSLE